MGVRIVSGLAGGMIGTFAVGVLGGVSLAQSFALPPAPGGVEVTRSEGIEFVTINPPAIGTRGYNPIAGPGSDGRTNFGTVPHTQPYRIARTEVTSDTWVGFLNSLGQMPPSDPALLRTLQLAGSDTTSWPGLRQINFPGPGFRWYLPNPETDSRIPVMGMNWRVGAIFCNWLHNGRTTNPQHLLSGAYDVSTFGTNPDGTFTDQLTRSPGARFWLPSLDEWLTAAHYDPNRPGPDGTPNQGGWWQFPTSSDTAPIRGLPGTVNALGQPAQSSAGLPTNNTLGVAAYPTVQSPWGLFDVSGNGREWTETVGLPFAPFPGANPPLGNRSRVLEGASFGSNLVPFSNPDELRVWGAADPTWASELPVLRIAAAIPNPSTAAVFAVGFLVCGSRKRKGLV
jgi:formylglycine-generating enzyme required for sulfatase activity